MKKSTLRLTRQLLPASLIAILMLNLILPTARAWKITTHVYFADIALADALDDGHVTIYRVDYHSGEILGEIGEYAVAPDILVALHSNAAQYRAGTIGPDAYPDMVTGQVVIHPDPDHTDIEHGSDAWLRYLWEQAHSDDYKDDPAVRAFVVGFLTHAAGDVYGHTFVNNFTGGPFTFSPVENAVKHVLLEDYIDKRLPQEVLGTPFFAAENMNVNGIDRDFIYRVMVDARPGTILDEELLQEGSDSTLASIPRIFSTIRADLQQDIAESDCDWWDLICKAEREYKRAWRNDIDDGLRAWPQTSHRILLRLGFNSEREAQVSEAVDVGKDYIFDHLLSMAGFPDFVPPLIEIVDIIAHIIPNSIQEMIDEYIDELVDKLLVEAIGMTKEQLKAFITNPEHWFDVAMNSGAGEDVTLERFNQDYLHLSDTGYNNPDEAFDYRKVPAAYNSVTMSKLTLLSQDEVNRLLSDLRSAVRLEQPNIMLGFAPTLDGDNQWQDGMVLAQDRQVYEQIFMRQAGETPFVRGLSRAATVEVSPHAIFLPTMFKRPLTNNCLGYEATIVGTEDDDTIIGTAEDDVIVGKGGNDVIFGGEGNDVICGGTGNDSLQGNQGNDYVQGNMGNDTVRGGQGNDVLRGGKDNDTIYGGEGNDKIYGDKGDDTIDGSAGYNLIFAGEGHDTCVPHIGNFECEN